MLLGLHEQIVGAPVIIIIEVIDDARGASSSIRSNIAPRQYLNFCAGLS